MADLSREGQAAHPLTVRVEGHKLRALELRGEGKSYRKIAEAMGIDVRRAYDLVMEGLAEIVSQTPEAAEQVKVLELQRLDDMLDRLTIKLSLQRREMVTKEGQTVMVPDPHEDTVAAILKIQERRARYLGLDAPQELVGAGGGPIQVSNVDAGQALLDSVEKLITRLQGGESADAVAASLRSLPAAEPASTNGHSSTNGAAAP